MSECRIVVPLVPPGVNHYVKHTRTGRHYVTGEAKAFKEVLWLSAKAWQMESDPLEGKAYEAEVTVFQGKGDKGDVDNYAKCVLDGLVEAGVIHSDAAITDLILRKRRDRENPRTEIVVRSLTRIPWPDGDEGRRVPRKTKTAPTRSSSCGHEDDTGQK